MSFYLVRGRHMPWGDYGSVLAHGMSTHRPRVLERIQLERTGPFIPPWTFPGAGDVIVTDLTRRDVESSGLVGLTFKAVDKVHIAHVEWDRWNLEASEPRYVPPSAAPEDYILARPHDPSLASAMGDLWEVLAPEYGHGSRELLSRVPRRYRTHVSMTTTPHEDFVRVGGLRSLFASSRAREWLEARFSPWVTFEDVATSSSN